MMQREFLGYITLALFPCHDPKNRSAVTNGDYPGEWLVAITYYAIHLLDDSPCDANNTLSFVSVSDATRCNILLLRYFRNNK